MENEFCARTAGIWQFIGFFLLIIKILVPVIIIILGMIDFFKAILSSDEKAIKKASVSLFQRLIAGVIIFFIPTLILVILNLVSGVSETLDAMEECKVCALSPTSDDCDKYVREAKCFVDPNSAGC